MFRKWLVTSLAIVSTFCLSPVLSAELPVKDISQDPNQTDIVQVISLRIMQGFPDGSFKPALAVTEDAFGKVLQRFLAIYPRGIDAGFASKGSQEMSRIRAISLIVRCLAKGQDIESISDAASKLSDCPDRQSIPAWALKYAAFALDRGLISAGEAIRPQAAITRSELAEILVKAIKGDDPAVAKKSGVYTSLVIDCRGLEANRSMDPEVFCETGEKIYLDPKNAPSQDFVDENGIVGYAHDLKESKRAGSNPLVINAISMKGAANQSAVVSEADKDQILEAEKTSHFLTKWNVVFLID